MPIYEYQCKDCGHQFDTLQKMSDEPLKDCPECMAPALAKLVSAPSFRLSGSGWYETDFKTDNDKKKNLADSGHKSADKTETKPEAATAKKESSETKADKPKKTEKSSSSTNTAAA